MELSATSHSRSSSDWAGCVYIGGRNFDLKPKLLIFSNSSDDFQEHKHKVSFQSRKFNFLKYIFAKSCIIEIYLTYLFFITIRYIRQNIHQIN